MSDSVNLPSALSSNARPPVVKNTPVVALGAGLTLTAVQRLFGEAGVPVFSSCAAEDFSRRSRWYRMIPASPESQKPDLLALLLRELPFERAVLVPCADDWAVAVAALPDHLAAQFPSSTPPLTALRAMVDKRSFSELLTQQNVPHPETRLLRSAADLHALPPEAFQDAILKPISSVEFARKFGIKGHFVKCREQAIELSAQLEFPILLQEYIPGPPDAGYFVEGFFDRTGKLRALLARRRLRMHPAILGNSSLTVSVPLEDVDSAIQPFLAMLEAVHYRGMFSAEFKFDARSGQFKLLEVNARAWWYVGFAAHCGVDLCHMSYRDALELPVDARMSYDKGRRSFFLSNDFHAWRKGKKSGERSIRSLIGPWLGAQEALFRWNDPLPAVFHIGQQIVQAFKPAARTAAPKRLSQPETRTKLQCSVTSECDRNDLRATQ